MIDWWTWGMAPAPHAVLLGRGLLPGVPLDAIAPVAWIGLMAAGIAQAMTGFPRPPAPAQLAALVLLATALLIPGVPTWFAVAALACCLTDRRAGGPAALIATALLWSALFPTGAALCLSIATVWLARALFHGSANDNPVSERYASNRWVPASVRHANVFKTHKSGE